MADLPVDKNWLVSPSYEVEKKWLEVQINERISRKNKLVQDIDDLKKIQLIRLEAQILILDQEIAALQQKLSQKEPIEVTGG